MHGSSDLQTIIELLITIAGLLAAILAYRKSAVAASRSGESIAIATETGKKADDLAVKSEQIHVLVNSNLTAVKDELKQANGQILALQLLVQTLMRQQQPGGGRALDPPAVP